MSGMSNMMGGMIGGMSQMQQPAPQEQYVAQPQYVQPMQPHQQSVAQPQYVESVQPMQPQQQTIVTQQTPSQPVQPVHVQPKQAIHIAIPEPGAEEKEAEWRSQPLPKPSPSIIAAENFDDDMAEKAADRLRAAMKGFGTDERSIKKVTTGYSQEQRMVIKLKYVEKHERSLIDDLRRELRGKHEKLCVGLWLEPGHYDAECVKNALGRISTDEDALAEVICTRTNAQLKAMKVLWKRKGLDGTLVGAVKDATDGSYIVG